jgi:hypothetical protein
MVGWEMTELLDSLMQSLHHHADTTIMGKLTEVQDGALLSTP